MSQSQYIHQEQSDVSQAASAASTPAADTSPLSELSGTPSLGVGSASFRGDSERVEAHGFRSSGVADAGSSDEQLYGCDYCNNTYADQEKLDSHLKDNKSMCAKSSLGNTTSAGVYICPRCDAQMSKKYSTERHIKDSCWKVCDECCEFKNVACDAFYTDGACKHCVQQGLPCIKHAEPVSNCAPELRTDAPPRPYKSGPRTRRAGIAAKHDNGKRKASKSPMVSPNSEPVGKRTAVAAARKEKRTIAGLSDKAVHRRPFDAPQDASDKKFQDREHVRQHLPVSGLHVQNRLGVPYDVPTAPPSQQTTMTQRMQQGQGIPMPSLPSNMLRLTPGHQYDGRDVVTVDQAVSSWPQTHNSAGRMQYIVDAHGKILNQSMIDGDELLQKVHCQQAHIDAWAAQYDNALGVNHVPPPSNPPVPSQNARRTSFNKAHPPESRLSRFQPVQSANFKIYEDAAHQKLRCKDFVASAPGSCMPSRQSSPQPTQDTRASTRPPHSEQSRGVDSMSQTMKRPVSQKLTQPVALQRSISFKTDKNDPVLALRVHSNTYDKNSTPIFSFFTIRASQKFGPHLDAYCRQRGKQYGVDWVFIYRYALGRPEDAPGERYIRIDYNMTPSDVQDSEHPEIKLRDMDTLIVMKARSRIAAMVESSRNGIETPLSPIGSQVSENIVDITKDETPTYQNTGTIANWCRLFETKMAELRSQVMVLNSENQVHKATMVQQTRMFNDLVKRNNELMQDKYGLADRRVGQVPPSSALFAATGGAGYQYGPAVRRNPFVDRLEAVRQPTGHMGSTNLIHQYQFPISKHGIRGLRPTYDSGAHEAFPDFRKNGMPTMQPAQVAAYCSAVLPQDANDSGDGSFMNKATSIADGGRSGNKASHVPGPQHMRGDGGGEGANAAIGKAEDVEMEE